MALHGLPAIYLSTVSLGPLTAVAPQRSPGTSQPLRVSGNPRALLRGVVVRF